VTGVLHLASHAHVARPWRGGGGVTRDIIAVPAGAGDDDFLWRASIATIAVPGPFSAWPGVDRAFMLLRGTILLTVGDRDERRIDPGAPAILFAGEMAIMARPVDGPCTALNLMARRGRSRIIVERWTAPRPSAAGQYLLLAEHITKVRASDQTIDLAPDDALLLTDDNIAGLAFDRPLIAAEIFA
jgi:environmental stress-induced protein Ves